MDDRRWYEVKRILDEASRLPPQARSGFVEGACGDDTALQQEVVSLLAFHDATRDVLGQPVFDVNAEDPRVGRRIGHYRIARLLGRGGMGKVYHAIREDDYTKQVAVKLIQQGLDADERIARFHEERQILAHLDHPAIARLLDGGTTDDGLPYLVMELVEGEPIDRYCDARRLDVRRRLELFRRVLAAVEFSHRHLVVHRDLKPGNVLVAADGSPKLIDFGIAKLLNGSRGIQPRRRPMSPRYASPEQVRGGLLTTATDVYSLGVLLYELLAGRPPYRFDAANDDEIERAICETTPLAPSAAVRDASSDPETERIAEARGTTVAKLRRQLADEVDAIVLKAIDKRPEQRYGSAGQLSADIGRHLSGRLVRARANTLLYRARKVVRRHRLPLAAAFLALVALASTFTSLVLRTRVARERAQAAATGGFVESLFRAADPDRADGEDLTVRELLDRGRDELEAGLEDQPLVRSTLLKVVGRVYEDLGDLDQAEQLLRTSLELQRVHDPRDEVTLAQRANDLAVVLRKKGDLDGAEALYREALALLGGCRSQQPDAIWIAGNLAWLRAKKDEFAAAERIIDCLEDRIASGMVSADSKEAASVLHKLGGLRHRQERYEEAEDFFRRALAIRAKIFGFHHSDVARVLNNLGQALHAQGKDAEAEAVLRRAQEIRRELFGADDPATLKTARNLARVLEEQRR